MKIPTTHLSHLHFVLLIYVVFSFRLLFQSQFVHGSPGKEDEEEVENNNNNNIVAGKKNTNSDGPNHDEAVSSYTHEIKRKMVKRNCLVFVVAFIDFQTVHFCLDFIGFCPLILFFVASHSISVANVQWSLKMFARTWQEMRPNLQSLSVPF